MQRIIISLSGYPYAGKTTTAKLLLEIFGDKAEAVLAGNLCRKEAERNPLRNEQWTPYRKSGLPVPGRFIFDFLQDRFNETTSHIVVLDNFILNLEYLNFFNELTKGCSVEHWFVDAPKKVRFERFMKRRQAENRVEDLNTSFEERDAIFGAYTFPALSKIMEEGDFTVLDAEEDVSSHIHRFAEKLLF